MFRLKNLIATFFAVKVSINNSRRTAEANIRQRNDEAELDRLRDKGKHAIAMSHAEIDGKWQAIIDQHEKRTAEINKAKILEKDKELLRVHARKLFVSQMDELEALSESSSGQTKTKA